MKVIKKYSVKEKVEIFNTGIYGLKGFTFNAWNVYNPFDSEEDAIKAIENNGKTYADLIIVCELDIIND